MTRTKRKLKGVNIGRLYHDLLERLAEKYNESADGSIRAQAETAIARYAHDQGVYVDAPTATPETPQDAT